MVIALIGHTDESVENIRIAWSCWDGSVIDSSLVIDGNWVEVRAMSDQ